MNETVLDTAMNGVLALAKRLYTADCCLGVILSPGTNGATWTCTIKGGGENKTVPTTGNGGTPSAAYADLVQQFHAKIKERHTEDQKALALSDKATSSLTLARA